MNRIPVISQKLRQRLNSLIKTAKRVTFANFLSWISSTDIRYPAIISVFVSGIGIILNTMGQNKFPFFFFFEMALLFTLIAAYYSIRKVQRFFADQSSFVIHSAGELTILVERKSYERIAKSNYNFIFPITFGCGIAVLTGHILKIQLDSCIKLYCLSALGVILGICAVGFLQYFYFILFILRLAKKANEIKFYDTALPSKTEWLVDLASMASSYSTMYFLVGLVYTGLFYVFSFSDYFGNIYSTMLNPTVLYILWSIIIIIIIIGFPLTSILGLYALKVITTKLKAHQEAKLKSQRNLAANASLQPAIDSLLILLNSTPNVPKNPFVSYLASGILGIINLLASIQAVSLLIEPLI